MIVHKCSFVRFAFCITVGYVLASPANAQRVLPTPYSLENGGLIEAIWWDVSGGQEAVPTGAAKQRYMNWVTSDCSLYGNGPVYKWIAANLSGTVTPYSFTFA